LRAHKRELQQRIELWGWEKLPDSGPVAMLLSLVALPLYAMAAALYTLFILIPTLIGMVVVGIWKGNRSRV
jgi:hypothetical protein